MILLKRLVLENFLSHPLTDISFENNEKLLIDGVSGSGKSSIIEAIVWALYGKGRVENKNLVLRGKKTATVTLELMDGETCYQIVRSTTNKAKNTLQINTKTDGEYKAIERLGIRDMQDWIENELLHASYTLFVNSIVYMQDNGDTFVKQTASRRKELLLEILRAGEYVDLYKKAGEHLNEELRVQADVNGRIYAEISLINGLKSGRRDPLELAVAQGELQDKLKQHEKDIKSIDGWVESLKSLTGRLAECQSQLADLPRQLQMLQDLQARIKEDILATKKKKDLIESLTGLVEQHYETAHKLEKMNEVIERDQMRAYKLSSLMSNRPKEVDYTKQILETEKQIKPLRGDSSKCPSGDECPFTKPIIGQIEFLEAEIEKRKKQQKDYEEEVEQYEKDIVSLAKTEVTEGYRKTHTELRALSTELSQKISDVKGEIGRAPVKTIIELNKDLDNNSAECSSVFSAIERYKKEEREIKEKIASLPEQDLPKLEKRKQSLLNEKMAVDMSLSSVNQEIAVSKKTDEMIAEHEAIKKGHEAELVKADGNIASLQAIKEAFSQRGVPAVVLDYVIPRLEERINEILSQLSDFRVRIDTQRQNSSGDGMVEGLFLNIYNDGGEEFDYDSYSGGQKLKITVAIAEALASLQKVGFRMFDEIFLSLDEQSTEEFTEVMDKLQAKFNQIICITHLRNVKDLFEDQILITRRGGQSFITK